MPTVYRSRISDYISHCNAADAYSENAFPRGYQDGRSKENTIDMPRMPRRGSYSYASDAASWRSTHPRERDYRDEVRPPPPSSLGYTRRRMAREPPAPLRRSDRNHRDSSGSGSAPDSMSPTAGSPGRKTVRFDNSTSDPSMIRQPATQVERPKTFSKDAPPAAISESAQETARRLWYRKPDDGGRPSARPGVSRRETEFSVDTTKADSGGTQIGSRDRDRRETERRYETRSRRR